MDWTQKAKNMWGLKEIAVETVLARAVARKDPNRCWPWDGARTKNGYGFLILGESQQKFSVHRISFMAHKGKIPKGLVVMHECDNPACFNPNHLFLGTPQDNMDDKMRKGRWGKKPDTSLNPAYPQQAYRTWEDKS